MLVSGCCSVFGTVKQERGDVFKHQAISSCVSAVKFMCAVQKASHYDELAALTHTHLVLDGCVDHACPVCQQTFYPLKHRSLRATCIRIEHRTLCA